MQLIPTPDSLSLAAANLFDMVFRGEITNAAAVGGLLAAARARDDGWATLRPADGFRAQ